ncbi:porin PorA family protein [Streptomyces marincola]|uniref:DUF3068 domain-containing protein n=1 Tax=Streptomyces marincola TaxID=2878388 RepID=A0A1W7D4Z2_9ACTN|nr:porin PorA family protein [Streptomyces marincola]ARP51740.1 hypothetical protein [Streptomyces marincola]ARQ72017.1 hypothetical protein CAG99_27145 [Streptomyces marincola]
MRRSTWILSGTAVVLVAASAVTRFAVYPAVHQVPSDTDTTFVYSGTASLLNAPAIEAGDLANAFLADVPVTVERRVQVVDTDGGVAVVSDDVVVTGPDDAELSGTSHRWAVDRTDLENRPAPEGSEAEEHQGLVISWPLDPEERDYTFWDPTTGVEAPAVYDRTEDVEGREAYVYEIEAAGELADQAIAERLPAQLPRDVLVGIAGALGERGPDPAMLQALPEQVPLSYAATTRRVAWIDAETGSVLNGTLEQTIVAQAPGPEGPIPLAPVNTMTVEGTEETVAEKADDAASAANLLWLVRLVIPLGLLILGAALVALAVLGEVRGRRRTPPGDGAGAAPAPGPAAG